MCTRVVVTQQCNTMSIVILNWQTVVNVFVFNSNSERFIQDIKKDQEQCAFLCWERTAYGLLCMYEPYIDTLSPKQEVLTRYFSILHNFTLNISGATFKYEQSYSNLQPATQSTRQGWPGPLWLPLGVGFELSSCYSVSWCSKGSFSC